MQRSSVRELVAAVGPRYQRSDRRVQKQILDEFCQATGYHRVYARWLLRRAGTVLPRPARPPRPGRYQQAEVDLLRLCWEVADRICGKRLAPFLPELLAKLAACEALPEALTPDVVERVGRMSAATVDRRLRAYRTPGLGRGLSTTRPGTLLKHQIPIKTFAEWNEAVPGFLEIDLVAHTGPVAAGEFLSTLSTVDVATGWSVCIGLRKGEEAVFRALERVRTGLPMALLGLDSDNGGEFINRTLFRYCSTEQITFTRSRPYRKNDGCHIEQKNWSVVRRLVGYARFEPPAVVALNRVYALAADYVNFFQPVLKLVEKTRDGPRVRKRYDQAQTPYQRLLASGALSPEQADALRAHYAALHPVRLKLALEETQQHLSGYAVPDPTHLRPRVPPGEDLFVRQRMAQEKIPL